MSSDESPSSTEAVHMDRNSGNIPFTPESVREHLDLLITHWRIMRIQAENDDDTLISQCYIDAFQSVRINLFGEGLAP